jgi:hypothetical protein
VLISNDVIETTAGARANRSLKRFKKKVKHERNRELQAVTNSKDADFHPKLHTTMGDANAYSGGENSDNTSIFLGLWAAMAVAFLLCPFISSANRRKLWAARIRERRWNVDVDLVQESGWYRGASERYERWVFIVIQAVSLYNTAGIRHVHHHHGQSSSNRQFATSHRMTPDTGNVNCILMMTSEAQTSLINVLRVRFCIYA